MWNERTHKEIARQKVFEGLVSCHHYLTLAGEGCEDIRLGLQLNVLKKTHITVIERNFDIFIHIRKWLSENHTGPHTIHYANLSEVRCKSIDLAFLDLLGNLTKKDALWFKNELVPNLMFDARIAITAKLASRRNDFIPLCTLLFREQFPKQYKQYSIMVRDYDYPKNYIKFIATYLMLIEGYLLQGYKFKITVDYYKDTNTMFLIRLINIQPDDNVSTLSEIGNMIEDNIDNRGLIKLST